MRRSRAMRSPASCAASAAPDLIVCVVAATNLRLSLRLVLELRKVGRPMIVALNMSDLAKQRGYKLDRAQLEAELGVPVVETVAVLSSGARALVTAIDTLVRDARCAPQRAERDASGAPAPVVLLAHSHRRNRSDAARGAAHPARGRLRRAVARPRARAPRCGGDASDRRAGAAGRVAVCDIPGGVQLGDGAAWPGSTTASARWVAR